MANKISEKELNNVSGGCGDRKTLYYKLYCFDSNNIQVGSVIVTERCADENTAHDCLYNKSQEQYLNNPNIKYIKWEYYKDSVKDHDGINYRESFIN